MMQKSNVRKTVRHRGVQKKSIIKKAAAGILVFLLIAAAGKLLFLVEDSIGRAMENAAAICIREYIEQLVIHAQNEVLCGAADTGSTGTQLISAMTDAEGRVTMVQLNTEAVNRMGNAISEEANRDIYDRRTQKLRISIGSLLGSKLLSQVTPSVSFDLMPVSVSEVTYRTEFESAGINQVRYQVYLEIRTEARVLAPFVADNIRTENTFLAAETVIVGNVPDTYADVSQDSLSDFVN